jgi:mono/diheme cytochrome c family protein
MMRFYVTASLLWLASGTAFAADLIKDQGWQLVTAHCSGCHSLQLVTGNRGDRQTWLETIRWMQESQNFWQLDSETEDQILTYLAKNYPPATVNRRPPLSPALLP